MYRFGRLQGLCALAIVLLFAAQALADKKVVKPLKEWSGSVADEALAKDTPPWINDAKSLQDLWKKWKIGEKAPSVDFQKEIVVVVTTRGGKLSLSCNLDDQGDLEVLGLATKDLRPGFRYVVATVSRHGVKTINGKELKKTKDDQ